MLELARLYHLLILQMVGIELNNFQRLLKDIRQLIQKSIKLEQTKEMQFLQMML